MDARKKMEVLKEAGKSLRYQPYNLTPLPTKTDCLHGNYQVYQYAPEYTNTVQDAINAAIVKEQQAERRQAQAQMNSRNRTLDSMFRGNN